MSELEEARKRIVDAAKRARTHGEYANGYNSGEWCAGRSEGFSLALNALDDALRDGQWCGK